ncbi:hypothetical protein F4009_10550 [Candidatus Poribacteria bacterium]|nr:hypothetical protein [Candidatus Poribacteria bacterium]MYA72107.1 hypothetical protein [Candidatus Poribacteria bacterium]MYH83262.1 hypothetical protein [Candidatus Poribacteria bacterium]MYK94412.1 hypothetical protein [Candidatus Poribacteria bacterium]
MARIHILRGFSDLDGALWVLKYHPELRTRSEIVATILENGLIVSDRTRFEILQLLQEWGIAESKGYQLTLKGKHFYFLWEMKPEIAIDVLHGLQYNLWSKHVPHQNQASWAYQRVCDYLWEYQILPESEDDLTAYVYEMREELDENLGNIANAFSRKSVNGAYDWLLPLKPPVLKDVSETSTGRRNFRKASFTRRTHCSPALFLMGLSWVSRESKIGFGELVEMTDERKIDVCRFCLIEPSSFDIMLNRTLTRFDFLSMQRIGRLFVIIQREPQIADF